MGGFQPFLGGGPTYAAFLKVEDRDVQNVKVPNSVGFLLRGGVEYMFNNTWGLSISANRLFNNTEITGDAPDGNGGTVPAVVDTKLNPWVLSFGLAYRL